MDRMGRAQESIPVVSCNAACTFCDERQGPLLRRLPPDLSIFSGGEPLLQKDLTSRIRKERFAKRRVIVETNGLLLAYPKIAGPLLRAQPFTLRVLLPVPDPAAFDDVMQLPGALSAWRKAFTVLHQQGVAYELSVPFNTWTQQHTAQLAHFLTEERLRPTGIVLNLRGGNPKELAQRAEYLRQRLTHLHLPVGFHETTPLPPCQFQPPATLLHFLGKEKLAANLPTRGGRKHHTCLDCVLDHGCQGVAPGLEGGTDVLTPLKQRTLIAEFNLEDTFQREQRENLLTFDMVERGGAPQPVHALLRVTFQCNHHCRFCWVNPHLARPDTATLLARLQEARDQGVRAVTLTGGEPTLAQNLDEVIRHAKAIGLEVYLQTHAMRLENEDVTAALTSAGVDFVFVSLHGHTPELSDAITGYDDGFVRTVAGVKNLLRAGIPVGISHVLGPENAPHLPDFARFMARELPGAVLMPSVAQAVNEALTYRTIVPPFSVLREPLKTLFAEAPKLGLTVAGLSGQCGIPPCVVDGDIALYEDLVAVPREPHPDFQKADFCARCRFNAVCWGPRQRYVEEHGFEGLAAIPGEPMAPMLVADQEAWRSPRERFLPLVRAAKL